MSFRSVCTFQEPESTVVDAAALTHTNHATVSFANAVNKNKVLQVSDCQNKGYKFYTSSATSALENKEYVCHSLSFSKFHSIHSD